MPTITTLCLLCPRMPRVSEWGALMAGWGCIYIRKRVPGCDTVTLSVIRMIRAASMCSFLGPVPLAPSRSAPPSAYPMLTPAASTLPAPSCSPCWFPQHCARFLVIG